MTTTTCVVCSIDLASKNYNRHYMTHLEGKYECPHCDKSSATKIILNTVEASHAKFEKMWDRYKVLDLERESHGSQLLRCVIDFNSKNL